MKVEVFIQDGTHVKPGDVAMVVEGKVQSLLQTERLMLNIMQRMSGIATMTNKYVKKLELPNRPVILKFGFSNAGRHPRHLCCAELYILLGITVIHRGKTFLSISVTVLLQRC